MCGCGVPGVWEIPYDLRKLCICAGIKECCEGGSYVLGWWSVVVWVSFSFPLSVLGGSVGAVCRRGFRASVYVHVCGGVTFWVAGEVSKVGI